MEFDKLNEYDKSLRLCYTNSSHRGPGKVVQNLQKGLEAVGVQHFSADHSETVKYTGVLQFCYPELLTKYYQDKMPILLGPNLFVLPEDNPSLCKMFDNFVVPSQWVKDLYSKSALLTNKNVYIWPVGIDTKEWCPIETQHFDKKKQLPLIDCFIYFKNRSEQDLAVVEAICKKFGFSYEILKYGEYQERELQEMCARTKFAILLTGTESQGVAYMQILSTNTPCYVFNNPTWTSEDGCVSVPASSVPYWNDRCGYKSNTVELKYFEEFTTKVTKQEFKPREFILENHTLEKSAQKYYNLLRVCHGDKPINF